MNPQLQAYWKRAQELASDRSKIDGDLSALQEELRHLSAAVNQKISQKELIVAELGRIQEATTKLVASGEWVLKTVPADPLSGVATGGQVAVISKTLDGNPLWNFVKEKAIWLWNICFNRPKKVNPSETHASVRDSSTKAS